MAPEFRTWIFSCTWICTPGMGPGTKQHLDLHTCGNGAWHKTTPGFVHLWEWGLAQDNTWIYLHTCGNGAWRKTTSGFVDLEWHLAERQHLDLHTWIGI